MRRTKTIAIDFDGVLHSYESGWQGADVANDPPVPNALDWLDDLCHDDRFKVCIFSSRNGQTGGIAAMEDWLYRNGMSAEAMSRIEFPLTKPPAHLTVDDRAFAFEGVFPSLDSMAKFKPWNKR